MQTQPDMTLQKIEALQKWKYSTSKVDMVPGTTLRETYSSIGTTPTIVSKDLYIEDQLVLGIEYNPEGQPVSAYSADKSGRKIPLDNKMLKQVSEENNQFATELPNQNELADRKKVLQNRIIARSSQKDSMTITKAPTGKKKIVEPTILNMKKIKDHQNS